MALFQSSFVPHMAVYKNLAVIGPQWANKQTPVRILFTEQTIFDFLLTIFFPDYTTKFIML